MLRRYVIKNGLATTSFHIMYPYYASLFILSNLVEIHAFKKFNQL